MSLYRYQIENLDPGASVNLRAENPLAAGTARRLSIVMVGMHLEKTRGGITTLTAGILNSAINDDHEVTYIASQAEDFGSLRKFLLAVWALVRFTAACLFFRPDLVYVHVGSNASLYRESIFILLAKIFGIRVLTHFHAGDLDNYYPFQPVVGRRYIAYALGLSDRLIAVSQESARQLRLLNDASTIVVVPNALDTAVFGVASDRATAGDHGEIVKLLFVGAMGKLKGEKDLIDALGLLKDESLSLKVSMLGYGAESLKQVFDEKGIGSMVNFLGAVTLSERIAFYKEADIFVLPTYAEAMPISVIEAMAAGLAVVTTAVGGIPEIIDDGSEGLLVPEGKVPILAQKISFLAKNRAIRLAMGKKARARVREQMNFTNYIKSLDKEIRQVCKVPRGI